MDNRVTLIDHDIIYVEKMGDQTVQSMRALCTRIGELAAELRAQDKAVLILSNASREQHMSKAVRDIVIAIGHTLDFDRSATFTSSKRLHSVRDLMIRVNGLDQKVANFKTEDEALAWLLSFQAT